MATKSSEQPRAMNSEGKLPRAKARRRSPTKHVAPVLTLVPNTPCMDTVEHLQELLTEALRGELVGLAYAALYRGRKYRVEAAGGAYSNPTFAAGMAASLRDRLGRHARGED
jgi:hypothetical protein